MTERSVMDAETDRVDAMTAAGKQKPELRDEDDRYEARQRASNEESGGGGWE